MNAPADADAVFHALAHATRRGVVARLAAGPAGVSELALGLDVSMPTFIKHLSVLEAAGVVRSEKSGRVRVYALSPDGLAPAHDWLAQQRALWARRFDQLDALLLSQVDP